MNNNENINPAGVLTQRIEQQIEWVAREFPDLTCVDVIGVLETCKLEFFKKADLFENRNNDTDS